MPVLTPETPLFPCPEAQFLAMSSDHLLLRHHRGLSLLRGITLAQIKAVLPSEQGQTPAQITAKTGLPQAQVCRLLEQVLYEAVDVQPPVSEASRDRALSLPGQPASILLFGHGPFADGIYQALSASGTQVRLQPIPVPDPGEDPFFLANRQLPGPFGDTPELPSEDLLGLHDFGICLLEGAPYGLLYDLQCIFLKYSLPVLFAAAEPDGFRLGPVVVPGTACIACAHRADFASLGPHRDMTRLQHLRTGVIDGGTAAADALQKVLLGMTQGRLVERVWTTGRESGHRDLVRDPRCQVCGQVETESQGRAKLLYDRSLWRLAEREERRPVLLTAQPADPVRRVCILGGGTAGYLAALALQAKAPWLKLTLIESAQIPVIGVGEATTPLLPQFLHVDLGLNIHRLFRAVQPTIKLGIHFDWGVPGGFHYPFGPQRLRDAQFHEGHIRHASLRASAMQAGKLPVAEQGRSLLGSETAYHLENKAFVAFLKSSAQQRGLAIIDAVVQEAMVEDDAWVKALVDRDGRHHVHDLFIDCSGFTAFLMGKTLGSPFVSFGRGLFTDRAIVAAVPHGDKVKPYTLAETMDAGWCWNTPMRHEDHRGYVFSSSFIDDDAAMEEMKRVNPGMGEPRMVRFRSGRHDHFWKGNVFALGNAYGFVEPLESTALHMVIRQIGFLLKALPLDRRELGLQKVINHQVNAYWDYLYWFLALHYKFNGRRDTPFWQACREETDIQDHEELVTLFRERGPLSSDLAAQHFFQYPDPLWGPEGIDTILLGQGVPNRMDRPVWDRPRWRRWRERCDRLLHQSLPQAEALELLDRDPRYLEGMLRAFRAAGPATVTSVPRPGNTGHS